MAVVLAPIEYNQLDWSEYDMPNNRWHREINVTDNVKLTRNHKEGAWYLNRYNAHYDRTDSIRFTSEEMKALKASLAETVIRVRN